MEAPRRLAPARQRDVDGFRGQLSSDAPRLEQLTPRFDRFDAILTPAAAGEAPVGPSAPTDLLVQRLWTALRLPAITLPGLVGPKGLPVGVQMVGAFARDPALLAVASWSAPHLAS